MICQPVQQVSVLLKLETGDYLSVSHCAEKMIFPIQIDLPCMRPAHKAAATMQGFVFRGQVAYGVRKRYAGNETYVI